MAKKVGEDEKANTVDPARLKKVIADIEGKIAAKLSHKMEYVESCKSFNEAISNAYEMGAAFVPKKVLKAKIKERELQRKIDGIAEDLEDDHLDAFEMISQALGEYADTPLGKAAVDAAEKPAKPKRTAPAPSKAKTEDDEDLRSTQQKRQEEERVAEDRRAAAENTDRLNAGISSLPH